MSLMPTPDPPLQIAVLGAGGIARRAYLPLLRTWPGTELVGIFSRTQGSVDAICSEWQIDFGTTDVRSLLARQPQAAFVLTNTPSHNMLVQTLLKAGVDVYVEKPATESAGETRLLAETAAACNRVFMVGFNRRFALLYRQAREAFGQRKVQLCTIEKHRPSAYHVSLYNNYLDDTIHQIDLLRFFCGEVRALHTSHQMQAGKLVGAVSVTELDQGGVGLILTSLQAGAWQERVSLYGEGLTVQVDAFRELRIRYPDREEVFGADRPGRWVPELMERGFQGAIDHFLSCVRSRQVPETDGHEAARTQELAEQLVVCAGEAPHPTPHPTWGRAA